MRNGAGLASREAGSLSRAAVAKPAHPSKVASEKSAPLLGASSLRRLLTLSGWGYANFHDAMNFAMTEFPEVRLAASAAPLLAIESSKDYTSLDEFSEPIRR